MSPSPDLVALYNRPIILWVEDLVTSTYLGECWNDPDIGFRVAGGHEGIRILVASAQKEGFGHVFGFVDRDFRSSNRPSWPTPTASRVFVPEAHEVENYVLEPDHLACCDLNNGGRSAAEVRTRLETQASRMVWWTACRRVLSELRAEAVQDFPSHAQVSTLADAERLICDSDWFKNLSGFATGITAAGAVGHRLTAAHGQADAELNSGQWQQSYSGKPFLRDLHNWLYTPPAGAATAKAEVDRDLVRSVARWQVANSVVPAEVQELRAALRQRVGLPP
ncbi:MAG: hypothetical protein L0Z62_21500 [Gemmataceae bacterium]|nr:hypothetical protein [Gemmataceae bacterium]